MDLFKCLLPSLFRAFCIRVGMNVKFLNPMSENETNCTRFAKMISSYWTAKFLYASKMHAYVWMEQKTTECEREKCASISFILEFFFLSHNEMVNTDTQADTHTHTHGHTNDW